MVTGFDSGQLEELYLRLNRREFIDPDPLGCVRRFLEPADREIAALVASCLAYGRVQQIVRSVDDALGRMGSPSAYVRERKPAGIAEDFLGFRHRFASGEQVASLLCAAGRLVADFGSLGMLFRSLVDDSPTLVPILGRFVHAIRDSSGMDLGHLLPDPALGSACKRLNMLLRWMVRRDEVDLGDWGPDLASRLVVPLDTHMHRISLALGLTRRRQADLTTALEVTEAFRSIAPDDPVRYDFALTRLGIRNDLDPPPAIAALLMRVA